MDEAGKRQLPLCQEPLTHMHAYATCTLSPTTGPFWTFSAGRCPATVCPPTPKPTFSEVSVCLSRCSSVGQTTLKWCSHGPARNTPESVQRGHRQAHFRVTNFCPLTLRPHLPPIKEANPLTVLSLCQFIRPSVLASISFLTCLFASVFFFFLSPSLSADSH